MGNEEAQSREDQRTKKKLFSAREKEEKFLSLQ